jgi:hypothetical protein
MRDLRQMLRSFVLALVLLMSARPAAAELMTFHLTVGDALASVGRTNAFLASLGTKNARGLKLVPGGTKFAGLTCAGFGDVYKLASVKVLDGTGAFPSLVITKRGRDAQTLATAFGLAGLTSWVPPALEAETDRQFWSAANVPHGLAFTAEALQTGTDSGLLDADDSAGIFRFRANVPPTAAAGGAHRFLVELIGRTSSNDSGGLVAFGEQRCFTFVDLVALDVGTLERLVDETLPQAYVQNGLATRVQLLKSALARRDFSTALEIMAYIVGHLVARTPEHAEPAAARRVVTGVFDLRRGLDFRAASAECGNGTRETGEACDGADLGGFTCENTGYASGTLSCEPSCFLNFESCVANPVCGNGILEINEECDSGAQNSDEVPDACRTDCKRSYCGDGVIDIFEDCEPGNLGGFNCVELGYGGGTLKCDKEYCEFDDENCRDDF